MRLIFIGFEINEVEVQNQYGCLD